VIIFFLQSSY